jgi:hypothetical protein
MRNKDSTAGERASAHEITMLTLRQAFERFTPGFRIASQGTRASITGSINHLAALAGIEKGKKKRAELYDAAVKAFAADARPPGGIEYVQNLCAEIRREWEANPLPPARVARLKQSWYERAYTLGKALGLHWGYDYTDSNEYALTTDDGRAEIRREIAALAALAGVTVAGEDYEGAYVEALKNFGGTNDDDPHSIRLREIAAEIDGRDYKEFLKESAPANTAEETPRRSNKYGARGVEIIINFDCLRCVGLVKGDAVRAREGKEIRRGDVAAVKCDDGDAFNIGRVQSITATHITLRDDSGVFTHERAKLRVLALVDHKNPTKADPLDEDDRERVGELTKKIEKLGGEDDQILRCTARYRYEKEIYDIEHPADDPDDWRAWEEEERGEE